jgi:hypothetical protein
MLMELKRRGGDLWDEDDKKKGKGGRKVFLASGRCAVSEMLPSASVQTKSTLSAKKSPNPALKC